MDDMRGRLPLAACRPSHRRRSNNLSPNDCPPGQATGVYVSWASSGAPRRSRIPSFSSQSTIVQLHDGPLLQMQASSTAGPGQCLCTVLGKTSSSTLCCLVGLSAGLHVIQEHFPGPSPWHAHKHADGRQTTNGIQETLPAWQSGGAGSTAGTEPPGALAVRRPPRTDFRRCNRSQRDKGRSVPG